MDRSFRITALDARGDTDRRNAPAVSRLVGFFGALVTTGSI
jgi:hypothetical protein